jgi:hypothetical protein
MKLLGKRILLNIPARKESLIELTPETERQLDEEMIKKWTELEVFAIGEDVTVVVPGDKVYISTSYLQSAERIIIGEEAKMMVLEFEIAIVW